MICDMAQLSIRMTIAYDGTAFLGWQETKEGRSVQGVLRLTAEQILQCSVEVEAASRTDAGVHATGQTVVLRSAVCRYPLERFLQSLQRLLPPDVAILDAAPCSMEFHPTLDASGKTYVYRVSEQPNPLWRHQVWHLSARSMVSSLDLGAMRRGAQHLVGRHDFSAFAVDHLDHEIRNPICELSSIQILQSDGQILIQMQGNRFLYKMCRSLAGTLIDCGRGRIPPDYIPVILESRRREQAGVCAPAHGLTLVQVHYPAADSTRC
jgi:tRNA pseudouridine38-40 synthase